MADEIVDIVDTNNTVLSQTQKSEAHEMGLLHRTVICEVIDSQGRWTLIQQNPHKQDPGQFVSPIGGHVAAGETPEDALIREAEEEGGLTDLKMKYVGKVIYDREIPHLKRRENHFFILYEVYSDKKLVLNSESKSQKKFTRDQLKQMLKSHPNQFGPPFKFLLKTFYSDIYNV